MKPMVLGNLSYGMYAIGVKDANKPSACIVNTVMQISKATPSDPPLVAVSVDKTNYSCECMEKEGIFTISVLSEETPATVIGALGFVSGDQGEYLLLVLVPSQTGDGNPRTKNLCGGDHRRKR